MRDWGEGVLIGDRLKGLESGEGERERERERNYYVLAMVIEAVVSWHKWSAITPSMIPTFC